MLVAFAGTNEQFSGVDVQTVENGAEVGVLVVLEDALLDGFADNVDVLLEKDIVCCEY